MSDTLLPPNATTAERALEGTTSRVTDVPVLVRESWDPDDCPEELLPWLAWAYSVDEWDPAWSEATKREAVTDAYKRNRKKGTVWAVKRQLNLFGYPDALLDEGATAIGEVGATWAHYRVRLAQLITVEEAQSLALALEAEAPKRSQLWTLHFIPYAILYDGTHTADGTYTHGEYA
jgi:phage tail P2-like protein